MYLRIVDDCVQRWMYSVKIGKIERFCPRALDKIFCFYLTNRNSVWIKTYHRPFSIGEFIVALVQRQEHVRYEVHTEEHKHNANLLHRSSEESPQMSLARQNHRRIYTIYLQLVTDVPNQHNDPMNLIDLDVLTPHAKYSNHYYYYQYHPRMKMAMPPPYPLLLLSLTCLCLSVSQGLHLQFPVSSKNRTRYENSFYYSRLSHHTLNFKRIGVSFSCKDLLHNSNASKSIGNLMSFKIFALIPSLPLYWNRTKFTVR